VIDHGGRDGFLHDGAGGVGFVKVDCDAFCLFLVGWVDSEINCMHFRNHYLPFVYIDFEL